MVLQGFLPTPGKDPLLPECRCARQCVCVHRWPDSIRELWGIDIEPPHSITSRLASTKLFLTILEVFDADGARSRQARRGWDMAALTGYALDLSRLRNWVQIGQWPRFSRRPFAVLSSACVRKPSCCAPFVIIVKRRKPAACAASLNRHRRAGS